MAESATPSTSPTSDGSGAMFDRIADRYDQLNRVISMGMDHGWRRKLVESTIVDGVPPARILDLATGTADTALALAKRFPAVEVVGVDPSEGMLEVGRTKVADKELSERIELRVGDAQDLPLESDSFDAAVISFGIRNVPDRLKGLTEMVRVTKPGRPVCVLELGEPRRGLMAPMARLYVHQVVPRLGAWLSSAPEYRYLQESIAAFPPPEEFSALMEQAGLTQVQVLPLNFGTVHLYTGIVAETEREDEQNG